MGLSNVVYCMQQAVTLGLFWLSVLVKEAGMGAGVSPLTIIQNVCTVVQKGVIKY